MTTTPPETRELFFVAASRVDAKGKKFHTLFRLTDLERDDSLYFAVKAANKSLRAGHVYSIVTGNNKNETPTFALAGAKWVQDKDWQHLEGAPTETELLQAQAGDVAVDMRLAADRLQNKEGASRVRLEKALEPVRKAYQELLPPHRLAFELYVLSVLRRRV